MTLPGIRYKTAPAGIEHFTGIDGCRKGWVAVHFSPEHEPGAEVIATGELPHWIRQAGPARLILIDMPIGLPDAAWIVSRNGSASRGCEPEARKLLGPRRSSVFNPPVRSALEFSGEAASAENFRVCGKKLSQQSRGILARIREADAAWSAASMGHAHIALWEAHPELAFRALNGGRSMDHWKRTPEGHRERMRLLERTRPGVRRFIGKVAESCLRKEVGLDDIADAAVLGISAQLGYPDRFRALPEVEDRDTLGRPMEMVFWEPGERLPHGTSAGKSTRRRR